jgi:hypothetical protein
MDLYLCHIYSLSPKLMNILERIQYSVSYNSCFIALSFVLFFFPIYFTTVINM